MKILQAIAIIMILGGVTLLGFIMTYIIMGIEYGFTGERTEL